MKSRATSAAAQLDRYTTMGDLTNNISRLLERAAPVLALLLAVESCYLWYASNPGAMGFLLMALGAMVALLVWQRTALGLPLLPMIVLQQLIINGLPIATYHDILSAYPPHMITRAGIEVLIFMLALTIGWRLAMQVLRPASAEAHALVAMERYGVRGLARLGFGLAGGATAYLVLKSAGLADPLLQLLPGGSYPIVVATVATASACGFFVLAMISSTSAISDLAKALFWSLMALNCLISASSLLLSSALVVISSVVIGLFWSTGRIPWRFLLLVTLIVSFLNTGKYAMRSRYWETADEENPPTFGLLEMPTFYAEWTKAGIDSFGFGKTEEIGFAPKRQSATGSEQTLFDRLNNLQNLLYVIETVENWNTPLLDGATYSIIPPLLIPRFLWKDKPRTHEGQVLLNVHFGRQALESTLKTYVAWGLLAEAYGNFGPVKGTLVLGLAMGVLFAWGENLTTRKPLLSMEGFVAFAIFLGLANSFETVASVMVTAIFQSLIPIILACLPFVRRKVTIRPESTAEQQNATMS